MKNLKKLMIASFMLVVAFVALVSSTYAWFSQSNTATVTGIELTAVAEGNLVVNGGDIVPAKSTKIAYEFEEGVWKVKPITYSEGWKIPESYTDVEFNTGSPDADLKLIDEADFNESTEDQIGYYRDYVIYLASSGEALEDQKLSVNLALLDADEMFKKALAISFYVGSIIDNKENYVAPSFDDVPDATVFVQDFYNSTDDKFDWTAQKTNTTATDGDTKWYIEIASDVDIPSCQVSDNGLYITMRIYFDGVVGETQEVYSVVMPEWKYTEVDSTSVNETNYMNYFDEATGLAYAAYDADATYYTREKDLTNLYVKASGSYIAATSYEASATYYEQNTGKIAYINSDNLPVKSLGLSVIFKSEK